MKNRLAAIAVSVLFAPAGALGQPSPFFGYGMVLAPLSVKWACGADSSGDISRIEARIAANPDDPAGDEVQRFLDQFLEADFTRSDIHVLLGGQPSQTLSAQQTDQICDAALRLEMVEEGDDPLTPEQAARISAQRETWRTFFQVLETLE